MKMNENVKKNKLKALCVLICFAMIICNLNTFSVAVSDNDGAAFITKAEFDSLKKNFQSQIDQYNTSIDSKIDLAIASYLSSIKTASSSNKNTVLAEDIYMYDNTSGTTRMRYVYGPPAAIGHIQDVKWSDSADYGNLAAIDITLPSADHNTKKWWQTKLVISDIDETKRIAAWNGRVTKAYDEVDVSYVSFSFNSISWGQPASYIQFIRDNRGNSYSYVNSNLFGQQIFYCYFGPTLDNPNNSVLNISINRIMNHWGNTNNQNVIIFGNNISYDCFSNYDDNRNWKYRGTNETLYQTVSSTSKNLFGIDGIFDISTNLSMQFANANTVSPPTRVPGDTSKKDLTCRIYQQAYWCTDSTRTGTRWYDGDTWRYPMVGFETYYITNWNQLYNPQLDSFAKTMVASNIKGNDTLMRDSSGTYHVPIYAGVPIVLVDKDQKVKMDFNIKTYSLDANPSSTNYGVETKATPTRTYIWAKSSPFTSNDPNSEADLKISGKNVNSASSFGSGYDKGYYITSSSEEITIDGIKNNNSSVWLKWSTSNKSGGGVLSVPTTVVVENPVA